MGPRGGGRGKGRHSRQWRLSMPAFLNRNKRRNAAPIEVAERPESPLVASAEAKPFAIREGKVGPFPAFRKKAVSCGRFRPRIQGWAPKGSRGRSESPLVASAEAKSFVIREKKGRPFSCLPQAVCFLWEVSSACGADEVLSITGKYPKGAGGGQRVHVSWPPPDPPLLSYSAPLASQGRAQQGSHPFPGGPLSPSAQSIPPPAPGRRFIPGVMARDCHGRDTLGEGLPRLPG